MLYNDKFCYIHMPKTAGTYVHAALADWGRLDGHCPSRAARDKLRAAGAGGDQKIFGTVRRPTAWYESVFLHAQRSNPAWRDLTFDSALESLLHPAGAPEYWPPIPPFSRMVEPPSLSLWTASVYFWYADFSGFQFLVDYLIDSAQVRRGLGELFGREDLPLGRVNHRYPGQFVPWSEESIERVRAADGELCKRLYPPADPRYLIDLTKAPLDSPSSPR